MRIIQFYRKLKKYIHNTAWIMCDRIIAIAIGFFIAVLLARYLGPEQFGIYSYAISVVALSASVGNMGLSGLVVHEIIKKPAESRLTLGTTFAIKIVGMTFGYSLLVLYGFFYEGVHSLEFTVLVIAGIVLFFRPFDVIEYWFQAFVQARYVSLVRISALAMGATILLALVWLGLSLSYLVIANLLQALLHIIGLLIVFNLVSRVKLWSWSINWSKTKYLVEKGWPIYLGSLFAVIYLKIDQVMLRWITGPESVGIYAVAAQISEVWYFIPTAIVASLFPSLITLKQDNEILFKRRLQQLFDILFFIAFIAALVVTLLNDLIISLFFGSEYWASARILSIHIWASLFIFMRAAFSKWIIIENAMIFSLLTQGAGAILNVILNFWLIPIYGADGAAVATLISYAFASFFSLACYKKTRPIFIMMCKSFISVFRYSMAIVRNEKIY